MKHSQNHDHNDKTDQLTSIRYSSEQPAPAWFRSLYHFLCPCFMKNNLIQEKDTKTIIIQKSSNPGDDSIYDKQYQIPQTQKPIKRLRKDSQRYQTTSNFQNRARNNSVYKSTTQMVNNQIKQLAKRIKRSSSTNQVYPIYQYLDQKLIELGNSFGKFLCLVKSVKLQPSAIALKNLKYSTQRTKKRQFYSNYIDQHWQQRYFIFQKFDEGVKISCQSWIAQIPQAVSDYLASKVRCQVLLDGFAGSGSASIKFAYTCQKVLSNDSNYDKLDCLITNSKIYGCENIQISNKQFAQIKKVKPDVAFIAPPYNYQLIGSYQNINPEDFKPNLRQIFQKAVSLTHNLIILLPPNIEVKQILGQLYFAYKNSSYNLNFCSVIIEKIYFMGKLKYLCFYVGPLVQSDIKIRDQLHFIYDLLKNKEDQSFHRKRLIRQLRQTYGMLSLLNFVLQSINLNINKTNIQNFEEYLIQNNLIPEQQLHKIEFLEEKQLLRLRKKTQSSMAQQQKINQINDTKTQRTQSDYSNYQVQMSHISGISDRRESNSLKRTSDFITIQIESPCYPKKKKLQIDRFNLEQKIQDQHQLKNSQSVKIIKNNQTQISKQTQNKQKMLKISQNTKNLNN